MRLGGLVASLLLVAGMALANRPAFAEPSSAPDPRQRQSVVDLAYVLGEAHALHRACAGGEDNTWRGRMGRLLQIEAPDQAFRQRLMASFNAGFLARNAEFPRCTLKAAAAERTAAARGRDLSRRLADDVSP